MVLCGAPAGDGICRVLSIGRIFLGSCGQCQFMALHRPLFDLWSSIHMAIIIARMTKRSDIEKKGYILVTKPGEVW